MNLSDITYYVGITAITLWVLYAIASFAGKAWNTFHIARLHRQENAFLKRWYSSIKTENCQYIELEVCDGSCVDTKDGMCEPCCYAEACQYLKDPEERDC